MKSGTALVLGGAAMMGVGAAGLPWGSLAFSTPSLVGQLVLAGQALMTAVVVMALLGRGDPSHRSRDAVLVSLLGAACMVWSAGADIVTAGGLGSAEVRALSAAHALAIGGAVALFLGAAIQLLAGAPRGTDGSILRLTLVWRGRRLEEHVLVRPRSFSVGSDADNGLVLPDPEAPRRWPLIHPTGRGGWALAMPADGGVASMEDLSPGQRGSVAMGAALVHWELTRPRLLDAELLGARPLAAAAAVQCLLLVVATLAWRPALESVSRATARRPVEVTGQARPLDVGARELAPRVAPRRVAEHAEGPAPGAP